MIGGLCRIRINKILKTEPFVLAETTQIDNHINCTGWFNYIFY